jgi:hypothetical protein
MKPTPKLVKVFDQGDPFATLLAKDHEEALELMMRVRSCWGADDDSLFEIKIEDPDDIEEVMDRMEG